MNLPARVSYIACFLITLFTSQIAHAQAGCMAEMEVDVYGEEGTVMAIINVPEGQTFSTDLFFRRDIPGVGAIGTEIKVSPRLSDGFPREVIRSSGDASPYNTWASGDNSGGTFNFTNNTSNTVFVLELSYIATTTAVQSHGLSGVLKNFRINGGATCVIPHAPPQRPSWSFACSTLPAINVGSAPVYTEPFTGLLKDEVLWHRVADQLPLRINENGHIEPYGRWFEQEFGTRVTLQARVIGSEWEDLDSRAQLSHSRSWGREIFLRSSASLAQDHFDSTVYDEFRLKLESTSNEPVDGSSWMYSAWIWDGERSRQICLESTISTVYWDATTSCAADGTRQIRAYVTNKSDDLKNYRIRVFDPFTNEEIHSSNVQLLSPDETGKIALSGIPTGRWKIKLYEVGVQIGATITHEFKEDDCKYRIEWSEKISCADDLTLALTATITNHTLRWADFRIKLFDPETGEVVHASNGFTIAAGETRTVTLGGVPEGTWLAQIYRDVFFPVGPPRTVTFEKDPDAANGVCDIPPSEKACVNSNQLSPLASQIAQNVLAPEIMEHSSVASDLMVTGCNSVPDNGIYIGGADIFRAARNLIATANHEVIIQTFSWDSDSNAVTEMGLGLLQAQDNLDFNEKLTVRLLLPANGVSVGQLPPGLPENPQWRILDPDKFDIHYGVSTLYPGNVHHDKAIIVDGVSMIITGANPQNNNNPGVSWYDIGVRVDGPAVRAAVQNFDDYWRNAEIFDQRVRQHTCESFSSSFCTVQEFSDAPIARPWKAVQPDTSGALMSVSLSRVNQGATIGGNDIDNPQDEAWRTVFASTSPGDNISIITPNINDDQFEAGVLNAIGRGVNVRILLGMGFNDQTEVLDGGTNCSVVDDFLEAGNEHLFIRWHTKDGVIVQDKDPGQTHAKFMAVTDASGAGRIAIVGSGNHDTQSWDRSHEYNILLDGREITDRLMLEAFAPVWNVGVPATINLCDSVRRKAKQPAPNQLRRR